MYKKKIYTDIYNVRRIFILELGNPKYLHFRSFSLQPITPIFDVKKKYFNTSKKILTTKKQPHI